ncbi:glycoside hydrolase family 15 protein [Chelatococcus reniformis]|uniref:glucan 1,4-alpha-glucosidase n=1 Tax=Chelatococcus reniformis TaxID=1494448 RepID=A0A916U0C0_9HYPH|nr:glycoside hydrolase family 15 protein [Chelatococcus reniformis]GGC54228.1 glucan 1,4-alpha-glucosidase [Chelatococcus reniformis]
MADQAVASGGAQRTDDGLLAWIDGQYARASAKIFGAISATHLLKERPGFGRTMRPVKGSVLASPELSSYDPDPDYFFHWLRDSSLTMDALRHLVDDPAHGEAARTAFADYVGFSLGLTRLSGAARLAQGDPRDGVRPDFLQFVRASEDIAKAEGDYVLGDTRYNPDGTLDTISWPRPQFDGTAMRPLGLLRYRALPCAAANRAAIDELVGIDLDCTARRSAEPCFDLWEEEIGHHFYTRLIQCAALEAGVGWARTRGDAARADRYAAAAQVLSASLPGYWSERDGFYLSRLPGPDTSADKALDAAVILGTVHAERTAGDCSVLDPRTQATLLKLEALFAEDYAVNRDRPADCGLLLGRYRNDRYYAGGAYLMTTLAAAEFYYRLAATVGAGGPAADSSLHGELAAALGAVDGPPAVVKALIGRGDGILNAVRRFTPPDGSMAEQVDQTTGAPASAKNLTWSYGGFITAVVARRSAEAALPGA